MFFNLLKKDFKILYGIKHQFFSIILFAIVQVVVASFAFKKLGFGDAEILQLTPGIIMLIFLFTGVVTLNTSFVQEKEGDALVGLLLTGIDSALIFLSKFLINFSFLLLIQILIVALHSLFFNLALFAYGYQLFLILFLSAFGFVSLGTIFSAIAVVTPGRELLLPLLLFPLVLPLISAAVFLMQHLFNFKVIDFDSFWFQLLCVYNIIAFMLSLVLFEYVLKE